MNNKILDILKKMNKYDKKATNPFLQKDLEYNPFVSRKTIHEQTYIWVDKVNRVE